MSKNMPRVTHEAPLRIGIIDTGINCWHSHVRGNVSGCRLYLDTSNRIQEDEDFRDLVGHGTAVAGIIRRKLPAAELFAVRVFERDLTAYPSLVARAVLRAASEGCVILNMSLGMPPGPGMAILAHACHEVVTTGCTIVAAGHPEDDTILPASLPDVIGVVADDTLAEGELREHRDRPYSYAASGKPRDLDGLPTAYNLWGNSFACARVTAEIAAQTYLRKGVTHGKILSHH